MGKRKKAGIWAAIVSRNARAASQFALRVGRAAVRQSMSRVAKPAAAVRKSTNRGTLAAAQRWLAGVAVGSAGSRRYHLFVPAGLSVRDHPPLLVMLHGCGQDGLGFARSTRMNAIAQREGFLVLYPEQDRLANAQGCWNWFETRSGRAQVEAALVVAAVDQVIRRHRADAARVAICGLSAGASLAALVAAWHPERFAAVAMHSGVRPGAAQSSATALAAMRGRGRSTAWSVPEVALPPLLVIQGTADAIVVRANARAAAHAWAHAGDARDKSPVRESAERRVQRGRRKPMRVVDFKRRTSLLATLVEIDGLGHAWSGGATGQPYSDPTGPDMSRLIWAFASRQFRRAQA
jgi:poly(hydroxyalkanoate) depolymerase family esterase